MEKIDFAKGDGLVPAIIQDANTLQVLMLGYMNQEAYEKTCQENKVTFFSRTKNRLWTKGEESGNFLNVVSMRLDCDRDTLLIQVIPQGPTCHLGTQTCWAGEKDTRFGIIVQLENTISSRLNEGIAEKSYVASLKEKGIEKIAQKVGEEAVETVIEALRSNDELFLNESADLLFHYLILLQAKGFQMDDVLQVLEQRKK
ncbi:MAG: bifunctional phosphoribosyl-AMP cyclohydrolase/phosphoribosyl-ATP diphosphatase HisIE [Bacteroidetes bacterium]|nr:bifunctional phosphoribosyl-AMP cyclohydrolase/phosphoribosyl-ATP diphosphatase HisIE [Bacteroidota bacterium]